MMIQPVGLPLSSSLLSSQRGAHSNASTTNRPWIGRHSTCQHRFSPMKHSRTPSAKIRHVARTSIGVAGARSNGTRRPAKEGRLIGSNVRSSCYSTTCDANQPVCQHFAFALHGNKTSFFSHVTTDLFQRLSTLATDVNSQWFTIGFHSWSCVNRVTEQTISRHR
jgi:hypothetical protein